MKNILKNNIIAGLMMLMLITAFAPIQPARAQTDLQSQISALLAQIKSLQDKITVISGGAPLACSVQFTNNLTIGSRGADVTALQNFLINKGHTIRDGATGYFGVQTQAAVASFQRAEGINPSAGYLGPVTRTKVQSLCVVSTPITPDTPTKPSTDPIVKEDGDITVTRGSEHTGTLDLMGGFDEIYSVEVKAQDSAMTINRMDFLFDKKVWRYIDTFVLYQDGKKVAEMKATENNISSAGNEYRLRFSNLNAIVAKNDKDTFVLEAKALSGLSGSREEDTLTVYMPSSGIRAIDTAKVTTQEPRSGLDPRTFDFRDAENDGEIVVSLSSDSPESGVLQVKKTSNSSNTTVMVASVKAKDSDIDVAELYVKVDSSEANVANVVRSLNLVFGGKTIAKESVIKNGSSAITGVDEDGNSYTVIEANEYYVHFDNLEGISIKEDAREKLTLKAEFYNQNGRYSTGTEVTFTARAIYGENVHDETIINGNLTTGSNSTFALYTEGLMFTFVGEEAKTTDQMSRIVSFALNFDVTAFGSDIYVPMSADRQTGTTTLGVVGAEYSIINGSGERYTLGNSAQLLSIKSVKQEAGFFKINDGSTSRVTLRMSLDNTSQTSDFYRAELEAFRFRVGSPTGTEYTITSGFNSFETGVASVNK